MCTEAYHGQLDGRRVEIPKLGNEVLTTPLSFTLLEVSIAEKIERDSIRENRCHLFLDVNNLTPDKPPAKRYLTSLNMVRLIPGGRPGWREQLLILRGNQHFYGIEEFWVLETMPSTEEIIGAIPRVVGILNRQRFNLWWERMTPRGWVLPHQEVVTESMRCGSPGL